MIKIIYAVMDQHLGEDFEDNLVFREGEYEIMIFRVPVLIEVDGQMESHPQNTCMIYKPGQRIHYRPLNGELIYSWIRFDCDEPLYTEFLLPFGHPVLITDYHAYIVYWQAVANENYWGYRSYDYVNEQLMHIIFHRLHDYAYHNKLIRYHKAFMDLRYQIYAHPEKEWTLTFMAKELGMSTRSLQSLYQQFFHISCINEVINSRIEQAKILLTRTDNSMMEIASHIGYHNQEHFCRQFKKNVGITPLQYRQGESPVKSPNDL